MTKLLRGLVVLLHGYGGSGAVVMPIAAAWRSAMPGVRFVAPDAPFPYVHGPGHQWFGVDGHELRPERIKSVRAAFDTLVTEIVRREGFESNLAKVALIGISQGAIVALDAVASGRWSVGALVSFAGLLPPIPISSAARSTPCLLVHGALDQTVVPSESRSAATRLSTAGFEVEQHVLRGVGHGISPEGLELARKFLGKTLFRKEDKGDHWSRKSGAA
jgi:phospholipase/carboxylesterase